MTQLIKSDFRKFFKDKLFFVVCILAVVFAIITPLLYFFIIKGVEELDPITEGILSGYISAKGQFFGAFSFGNNLGPIAPLLIGIILYKDFNYGTVRNKIISGHSRTSIFLSTFVVCTTALFGIILIHALLSLGISLPFFDYQETPFTMSDFWYLLESVGFEFLIYIFASALITWLCTTRRSVGMVIIMYIAIVFGATIIAGVLQVIIIVLSETNSVSSKTLDTLNFIQRINVFNSSATIGLGTSYTAKDVLYYTIPPFAGTVAIITHSIYKFNHKDIK